MTLNVIGKSIPRKEAWEKVTGAAKYTNDYEAPGLLHTWMVLSPYAHAKIKEIDTSDAWRSPGVRAILTGDIFPYPTGPNIADHPPIAVEKVRYHGEPVAVVVADHETDAKRAAELIRVEYEPLPVVNSPREALNQYAPLVHEQLGTYKIYRKTHPVPGTNIANLTKIRKGDIQQGWRESQVIVETVTSFNQSDHAAIELRCAWVEIRSDGQVHVYSSTQSPYVIPKLFSRYFGIDPGNVIVHAPFVGGGFGGKSAVQLEYIAYLASQAVGGRPVKVTNTREQDMITSPVHIGLEAHVRLGATQDGKLRAIQIKFLFDGGAYSEMGVIMSKAAAVDCTGPYRLDHVWCDSFCLYTNHPPAYSFRGFGHSELTFAIERTMDLLAKRLNVDPLELRLKNAIAPGDTTPTQVLLDFSNIGDVSKCLLKLKEMIRWDEGQRIVLGNHKVRAKGISAIWKTSSTTTNAGSGAILTFNPDGSVNLNFGAVEIGQGTKTVISQIVAERLKMDIDMVHVAYEVNTQLTPEHWKTVASSSTVMAGRAALEAADDAIRQLKRTASIVLRCLPEELEVGFGRVYLRENPEIGVEMKEIALGYTYPNGNSIEGQVIGRGNYIVKHLTELDPKTGKGKPGPYWTVGAQAVEVEYDTRTHEYVILKAYSVIDAGKVLNPSLAKGQIMGGMHMGLSFASRESFLFNEDGLVLNPQFRTYKLLHFGGQPEYAVEFETPLVDGPYGARGIGEYGVIGMPSSLANALSVAAQVEINQLPLVPELIWKAKRGERYDLI